jgi:hypothetical protein
MSVRTFSISVFSAIAVVVALCIVYMPALLSNTDTVAVHTQSSEKIYGCRVREAKAGLVCGFRLVNISQVTFADTTFEQLKEREFVYCKMNEDGYHFLCSKDAPAREKSRAVLFTSPPTLSRVRQCRRSPCAR